MGAPRARLSPHRVKRGSWVCLFAMLMIFIGPLISQSMPMDQRASMSMSMDMSAMEHADHGAQAAAEHCPPKADHHALWEKCGYCSLLSDGKRFPLTMHFEKSGAVTVDVSVQKKPPESMQTHAHAQ